MFSFPEEKLNVELDQSFRLLDLEKDAGIEDADNAYKYLYQMINLIYDDDKDEKREQEIINLNNAYESVTAYMGSDKMQPDASLADAKPLKPIKAQGKTMERMAQPCESLPMPEPIEQTGFKSGAIVPENGQHDSPVQPMDTAHEVGGTQEQPKSHQDFERQAKTNNLKTRLQEGEEEAQAIAFETTARHFTEKTLIEAGQAREWAAQATSDAKTAKMVTKRAKADAKAAMYEAEKALNKANNQKDLAKEFLAEADKDLRAALHARACAEEAFKKSRQIIKEAEQFKEKARLAKKEADAARQQAADLMAKAEQIKIQAETDIITSHPDKSAAPTAFEDLLEIEKSLKAGTRTTPEPEKPSCVDGNEKRSGKRVVYQTKKAPHLVVGSKTFPVLDFCTRGLRVLGNGHEMSSKIVRGAICFDEKPPISVTGKIIRSHENQVAVKLATRIPNMIIEQELERTGQTAL